MEYSRVNSLAAKQKLWNIKHIRFGRQVPFLSVFFGLEVDL